MTISKRIADGTIVDLNALIVSLWGSAELLKYGEESEKVKANKKLEAIKNDINGFKENEGLFIESLKHYYHFNSDEIKAVESSKFYQYIKEIKGGDLDTVINTLKSLNNKLERKINDYFSPRRFEGAYL